MILLGAIARSRLGCILHDNSGPYCRRVCMLSIVIPWRDRRELSQTILSFASISRAVEGEVIVVNFGGDPSALSEMLRGTGESVRTTCVTGAPFFSKPRAQNIGASRSAYDLFLFCDCDVVVEPRLVRQFIDVLVHDQSSFVTLGEVVESVSNARGGRHISRFGYRLDVWTSDGRYLEIVDHEEDASSGVRQAPGILAVRREHFLQVGGFNSRLVGWGWEDQDMVARLTLGLGLRRVSTGRGIHISHGDDTRVAAYPIKNKWESRDRSFRNALANYDAADFMGSYLDDVEGASV